MMNPQLLDHLFVVIVLVIVFPFGGLWAYRRFLARVAAGDESALVTEYRLTLVWLAGLLMRRGSPGSLRSVTWPRSASPRSASPMTMAGFSA